MQPASPRPARVLIADDNPQGAEEGHLRGMAVAPSSHGSGVAFELLLAIETELTAAGCTRVTLDTTAPLVRAIRFYERNGYARSGAVSNVYGMPLHEYRKALQEMKSGSAKMRFKGDYPMKANRLLALGALCAPVFMIAFMIEGFGREQYNWLGYSISSLSIGPHGWMQITNFIVSGSLIVLLAIGLRLSLERGSRGSVFGPIAVAIAGIGFIGAGIFVSDPVFGYPPDQPLVLKQFTTRGHLHDFFSMFWFIGVPTACFVLARRFVALGETTWAIYSILSAVGMLVFFVLAGIGFNQTKGFVDYAGVYQRLSAGTGVIWLMLLALHQIGAPPASSALHN